MSIEILERLDDRLARIEAELALIRREQQRLGVAIAERDVQCARCRLQMPTLSGEEK